MATDPACLMALRTLVALFDRRQVLYALVGGTAVQLMEGVVQARFTVDVDAIVLAHGVEELRSVLADLETRGWQRDPEPYRMLAPGGCRIDILPYLAGEIRGDRLRLPGTDRMLSTAGWIEAVAAAQRTEVPGIGAIRIAPPQNLAALKVAAWHERGGGTNKDAYDLFIMARRFGSDDDVLRLLRERVVDHPLEARAALLARAIREAVPTVRDPLRALGRNLADPGTGAAARLWRDWQADVDQDALEGEIRAVGRGLLIGAEDAGIPR
ncbi:MAG TPA: nucleotidyl transferase AbiEii/AbiGii toxin family protein [bacterium]|nr:nucleotidyl transferase AbiEii/AbiGii toxin family protein [bacterium]